LLGSASSPPDEQGKDKEPRDHYEKKCPNPSQEILAFVGVEVWSKGANVGRQEHSSEPAPVAAIRRQLEEQKPTKKDRQEEQDRNDDFS